MNIFVFKTLAAGMLLASTGNTTPTAFLAGAVIDSPSIQVVQNTNDPLDTWIDKLAYMESEGRNHIKILDHNNRYSYGCLQFQMQTFRSYLRKYDMLGNTEDAELENMIYDCDIQKTLAKRMIQDDSSNWRNWYTSVSQRNLGLPPRISTELAAK